MLGYVTVQIVTTPAAATPEVGIENTQTQPDGNVRVTVALSNPRDRGLEQATATVTCKKESISVQFAYVPARSTQMAYVVCPPGTERPTVSLFSRIE